MKRGLFSFSETQRLAVAVFTLISWSGTLVANPAGQVVISGGADVTQQGSTLTVHQTTDRAVIQWQDFSIGHGELTQFVQPSATSAVLNRVAGENISTLDGTLLANGQVFLINPHGVIVGSTGVINTAGFTASTLDVADAEFLRGGDLRFFASGTGPAGEIVNLGKISALQGDVVLIARQVTNAGEIHAPNGMAALAAGSEVLVKASGEERVFVQPAAGGQDGRVDNQGAIQAATAELKAAGGNEYALAINNTGTVRATGVERRGGRVFLSAGGKGGIASSGRVTARRSDGGGGQVRARAGRQRDQ